MLLHIIGIVGLLTVGLLTSLYMEKLKTRYVYDQITDRAYFRAATCYILFNLGVAGCIILILDDIMNK
ncbi:hypothetical protein ANTHONY_3 [Bacillus phage Anthony]|uniref:Uncharacterized protein n=1 Tax=Bacillus phage Anthony TaxID=2024253 RepID=A0A223LFT9_9CAUD|nr:hypothetical protein ANTHONY_3 [Bacillus phage Anthony]